MSFRNAVAGLVGLVVGWLVFSCYTWHLRIWMSLITAHLLISCVVEPQAKLPEKLTATVALLMGCCCATRGADDKLVRLGIQSVYTVWLLLSFAAISLGKRRHNNI